MSLLFSMSGKKMFVLLGLKKQLACKIYCRLLLELPEVGWNTIGTIWLFEHTVSCPVAPEAVSYMKGKELNLVFSVLICLICF